MTHTSNSIVIVLAQKPIVFQDAKDTQEQRLKSRKVQAFGRVTVKAMAFTINPAYYRDYFCFVNDPKNRLQTMTIPFDGGFEITVRV